MALTAYLTATSQLLQNPVPSANPLYSQTDLTTWINEGRQKLAAETECIRASSSMTLSVLQQIYSFSSLTTFGYDSSASGTITFGSNPSPGDTITLNGVLWTFVASGATGNQTNIQGSTAATITTARNQFNASVNASLAVASYTSSNSILTITYKTAGTVGTTYTLAASAATVSGPTLSGGFTALTGISSALTIRQMLVTVNSIPTPMYNRSWPWFMTYFQALGITPTSGTPTTWAQLGRGSLGSFGVGPLPAAAYPISVDCACLPVDLTTDFTAEAIPSPFTQAIPYYAAYKAYLSSQKTQDATTMYNRYMEFARNAIQENTPPVLPLNHPGSAGSALVASKTTLTMPQQQQGR